MLEGELEINVPLLRKTLEHVREHPEEWRQHSWGQYSRLSCGTVGCFAHHAVRLDGGKFISATRVAAEDGDDPEYVELVLGQRAVPVRYRAQRALGLSGGTRGLFWGANTLEDLERIVGKLIREAEGG